VNYISKQFAGAIIQGVSDAIEAFINTVSGVVINYFLTLAISTANSDHSDMIGRLIGFPRPLVQIELLDSSFITFSFSYYRDIDVGFAASYDSVGTGGRFPGGATNLVLLPLATYKAMLRIIATAKRTATNNAMSTIDQVCKYIAEDNNYTIAFTGTRNNILITFQNVSVYSVYVAGYILNYLFDTEPDITVTREIV